MRRKTPIKKVYFHGKKMIKNFKNNLNILIIIKTIKNFLEYI
jgi:hypothetical protein